MDVCPIDWALTIIRTKINFTVLRIEPANTDLVTILAYSATDADWIMVKSLLTIFQINSVENTEKCSFVDDIGIFKLWYVMNGGL